MGRRRPACKHRVRSIEVCSLSVSSALDSSKAAALTSLTTHLAAGELGQAADAHKRRVAYEALESIDWTAAHAARAASPPSVPRYGLQAGTAENHLHYRSEILRLQHNAAILTLCSCSATYAMVCKQKASGPVQPQHTQSPFLSAGQQGEQRQTSTHSTGQKQTWSASAQPAAPSSTKAASRAHIIPCNARHAESVCCW